MTCNFQQQNKLLSYLVYSIINHLRTVIYNFYMNMPIVHYKNNRNKSRGCRFLVIPIRIHNEALIELYEQCVKIRIGNGEYKLILFNHKISLNEPVVT